MIVRGEFHVALDLASPIQWVSMFPRDTDTVGGQLEFDNDFYTISCLTRVCNQFLTLWIGVVVVLMPAVFEEEWHMSVMAKETFLRSFC